MHLPTFSLTALGSTTTQYISHAAPVVTLIIAIFAAFFIIEIFTSGEDKMTTHDEWV